jgi:hypothetical protein
VLFRSRIRNNYSPDASFSSTPFSKIELLISNIYWAAKEASGL